MVPYRSEFRLVRSSGEAARSGTRAKWLTWEVAQPTWKRVTADASTGTWRAPWANGKPPKMKGNDPATSTTPPRW